MNENPLDRESLIQKINTLYDAGDFVQALACLEQLAQIVGETPNILDYKFDLLMRTGKYLEARAAALKLEETSSRKSPWNCLKIAEACLGTGNTDEALSWLEKAVLERSFKRSDVFANPAYDVLRENAMFLGLVEKARENTGIGTPAPDFSVPLLDGNEFTLSTTQSKVVLIDFWDTDCPPCIREMPALKALYAEFQEQGFEIIGISLDARKSDTEKFVAENGIQWKVSCSGKGFLDETASLFKIEATPSTWLVDKKGLLRFYNPKGPALREAVQQLLSEQNRELKCRGDYCTL